MNVQPVVLSLSSTIKAAMYFLSQSNGGIVEDECQAMSCLGPEFGPNILYLTTRLMAIRKRMLNHTFLVFQNFGDNVLSHKHIIDNIKRLASLHLSKHLVSLNKKLCPITCQCEEKIIFYVKEK